MKNRTRLLAALGLAVLVGVYLLFRWRENGGHHPEFGDVATWLGTVAAWLAAGGAAVAAYFAFGQLRELRGQANLQAEALERQAEQLVAEGEARRKQAALMDEQLAQVRQANRALVRQQAEQIDFFYTATAGAWAPRNIDVVPGGFHIAVVRNNSTRPIRDVSCYISV